MSDMVVDMRQLYQMQNLFKKVGAAKSLSLESVQMHLPSCGGKLPSAPSLSVCVCVCVSQSVVSNSLQLN